MSNDIVDVELLEIFLGEAVDYLELWESSSLDFARSNDLACLDNLFRVAHNLKGSSRTLGMTAFGDAIHRVEDLISLVKDNKVQDISKVAEFFLECNQIFSDWLSHIQDNPAYVGNRELIDKMVDSLGHQQNLKEAEPEASDQPQQVSEEQSTPPKQESDQPQAVEKKPSPVKVNASVRVSSKRLDHLIQLVGELLVSQSIIRDNIKREDFGESFKKAINFSDKLSKEIQDEAISLRMHSLKNLFQRLERTIMDIAGKLTKDVLVDIKGSECELDKQAIEVITDPLIHIVRNAVDHGIEGQDERAALGKSSQATICIEAKSNSDGVIIKVSDDGKGLDTDKIKEKAIANGILSPNDKLDKEDLLDLIFHAGFSTAEKVTDISGRGVGLDVVKKKINEVGGKIKIETQQGFGSCFYIVVPLNINISDALIGVVGGERVILPLGEINEVVSLSASEVENSLEDKVFHRRGKTFPLVSMGTVLNLKATESDMNSILIVESDHGLIALGVDGIIGQQSIIIRNILGSPNKSEFIAGATILGDGKPAIIINLKLMADRIISSYMHYRKK